MDPKNPGAGTVRASLESVERQSGQRDPRLDSVKVPEELAYLWRLFWEVRGGASEGFGGTRITWRDLADYQAVTGIALDAFELEAVLAMDRTAGEALSGDSAKE